ncbi:MAG: CcmD family protein [Coriobacteriales bacterium]|jgi:CcmD family protein|nr:CcmD family protein [Coriobacteriales bacterium]
MPSLDPVLSEIYSTVLEAAPFVIGAYALIWLVLLVYVVFITLRLSKTERQMALLEELLTKKKSIHE